MYERVDCSARGGVTTPHTTPRCSSPAPAAVPTRLPSRPYTSPRPTVRVRTPAHPTAHPRPHHEHPCASESKQGGSPIYGDTTWAQDVFVYATSPEVSHAPVRLINTDVLGPLRPMADFQYILPGAIGLPQGSNLYLWNPHIICGRSSMRQRTPGPSPRCDVASREWACIFTPRWLPGVVLSTRGSTIAR